MCIFTLGFFSCQPVLKLFLGIKNPNFTLSNEERKEYYQPFIVEKKEEVFIYALKDTSSLNKAGGTFTSYPSIYAKNRENDSVYLLNCFEDISWDVENINKKDYSHLTIADSVKFNALTQLLELHSELVHTPNEFLKKDTLNIWSVYMVSGTFLGKKLRKRMLPVVNINALHKLEILDISLSN